MNLIKITKKIALVAVLLVAFTLRIWQISSNPPSLTVDEAAIGYNAYSILKTGKDEHGDALPIIFKSFGDYKPGLYIYTVVPFVMIFGLNEFAVRFPAIILAVLCVYLLYHVTKLLFPDNKLLPTLSALGLAISPLHIQFTRGAWETGLSLTLTLAGIFFFLKSLKLKSDSNLLFSAIFFALTFWAYQSAKLATPLVILGLGLIFRSDISKFSKKILVISGIVFTTLSVPVFWGLITGETAGRVGVTSLFSYQRPIEEIQDLILSQANLNTTSIVYKIFYSENLNTARGILLRYFNYYAGRFLFFEGDWANENHRTPGVGSMLFADILIFIFGLAVLLKSGFNKGEKFILYWFLVAPIVGAVTRDSIQLVRSFNFVIPLVLIWALGLRQILNYKKIFLVPFLFVYIYNFGYFLDQYLVHAPKQFSKYYQYGYKQLVQTITPIQNDYSEVVVEQSYDQPYIYFLFYQKYDPKKFQAERIFDSGEGGDVGLVGKLDNISFRSLNWSGDQQIKNTLVAGNPLNVRPEDKQSDNIINKITDIKYLNGQTAFVVVEIK